MSQGFSLSNSYSAIPKLQADTTKIPDNDCLMRGFKQYRQHGKTSEFLTVFEKLLCRPWKQTGNTLFFMNIHTVNTHTAVLLGLAFVYDRICLSCRNLFYFIPSLESLMFSYVKSRFSFVSINDLQLNQVLLSYQCTEVILATLFIEHLGLPFKMIMFSVCWSVFNLSKPPLPKHCTKHTSRRASPSDEYLIHLMFIFIHTGAGI